MPEKSGKIKRAITEQHLNECHFAQASPRKKLLHKDITPKNSQVRIQIRLEMDPSSLDQRAQALLRSVVHEFQNCIHSSHSLAIYDTAWVSMVAKAVNEEPRWVFPESFQYLLEQQEPDGGWNGQKNSEDGILNTLAAVLAMKRHEKSTAITTLVTDSDLHFRISKAVTYLHWKLQQWDEGANVSIGFEILVPALLSMLEQEQLVFHFPRKQVLMRLNAKKMKHFDPSMLYGNQKTSLLHSLEAFIGKIDFDRIRHQKTGGGMMLSASSTAAYLMNCSTWDVEAENYIRNVILHGSGQGRGGVACAYPANFFEVTWVVSTLLRAGYTTESLGHQNVRDIVSYLEGHFHSQNGLFGSAPSELPSGDETAKTVLTLNLLGRPTSSDQMISFFKANRKHLLTFHGERDPSLSTNCNGLIAILHAPEVDKYLPHIEDITDFLCNSYLSGMVTDKWHTSPHYPMMLLAEALMCLVQLWSEGHLELLPQSLIQDRVLLVLMKILNRTLLTQHTGGDWGLEHSSEESAYGILTLLALQDLPHARPLFSKIQSSIQAGRQFLVETEHQWNKPRSLWIGKVTYGSSVLTEAYCLAAMHGTNSHHLWSDKMEKTVRTTASNVMSVSQFFHGLPGYSDMPSWKILSSVIEGCLYLQKLTVARHEIFPDMQSSSKDKFLDFIPSSWIIASNCTGAFLDSTLIWDMMEISVLGFLVDEYMESVVPELPEGAVMSLRQIIRALCRKADVGSPGEKGLSQQDSNLTVSSSSTENGTYPRQPKNGKSEQLGAVQKVISGYVRAITGHSRIQNASSADQSWLQAEVEKCLFSHLDQMQDNHRFQSQDFGPHDAIKRFQTPRTSHYDWSHHTAANQTTCCLSIAFYACRLASDSSNSADLFPSSYTKYLARDFCNHCAVMTRLYNDYGSIARDHAETNLNSVNFPEFHFEEASDVRQADSPIISVETRAKESLLSLAQYERTCAKNSFDALAGALGQGTASGKRLIDSLRVMMCMVDLFADMYEARDLSNRIR